MFDRLVVLKRLELDIKEILNSYAAPSKAKQVKFSLEIKSLFKPDNQAGQVKQKKKKN